MGVVIPTSEARRNLLLIVIDRNVAVSDDFEFILLHEDGGIFVDADPEQIRMSFDDGNQVEDAISHQDVLVDADAPHETKPHLMIAHHDVACFRIAADQE